MEERILVCLSSSPSNGKIIRTAAQMAEAFNGTLTALFVETPLAGKMGKEDQERLKGNIKLAKQSGAEIETVYGDDISFQIAEFARLSGITRIVIGRSAAKKKGVFAGTSLVEKLIDHAPEMEIYIIPDSQMGPEVIRKWNRLAQKNAFSFKAAVKSAGILFAATAVGWLFEKLKLTDANIITVYILGVLLISIVTEGWFYSFSSTIASVLIFNFLFTAPRFTLRAYDRSYPFTFAVMFLAALITGSLASRLKQHAGQAARDAYRLKVLLDTNQLLQQAKGKTEILEGATQQIVKLLKREYDFGLCCRILPLFGGIGRVYTDSWRWFSVRSLLCVGEGSEALSATDQACHYPFRCSAFSRWGSDATDASPATRNKGCRCHRAGYATFSVDRYS